MLPEGYRVTAEHQASHWWYAARRRLVMAQVALAAAAVGAPERRLRLLDWGCATGFDLAFLAEWGQVEGADVDDPELRALRRETRFPLHQLPRDLPRLRAGFDVVTCLDVLEHLDDDVGGLRDVASTLAAGGQIVLTVPAYDWLWSGEDVISAHRRRYTLTGLRRTSAAAGLRVVWASYFNLSILPAMALVVWGRRLLRRDWAAASNLTAGSRFTDPVVRALTALEAGLVGRQRLRLPAGTSLVARLGVDGGEPHAPRALA